jgi:hypothetical protein
VIRKIVSGGQTGADRAALDFALAHGFPHGGWCPRGRWAEDRPLPRRYKLAETPEDDPMQRTEWNVRDSDATIVFSIGEALSGGSARTEAFARTYKKPFLHLSRQRHGTRTVTRLSSFLLVQQPDVLNIAGPRASEEPEVSDFTRQVLEQWWQNHSAARS